MQSLRVNNELDKNDFRQHMYAIRIKPIVKPSNLHEFSPSSATILEFDDNEEIVSERKRKQERKRDEDTKMNEADSIAFSEELRIVDVNSQLSLSLK